MNTKISLFILITVFLASCKMEKGWIYTPNTWTKGKPLEKTLAIKTFSDARKNKNTSHLGLCYIPAFPFDGVRKIYQKQAIVM